LDHEVTLRSLPQQEGQDFIPKPTISGYYKNWGSPKDRKVHLCSQDEESVILSNNTGGDGVLVVPRLYINIREGAQLYMTPLNLTGMRQYSTFHKASTPSPKIGKPKGPKGGVTVSEPNMKIDPTYRQL
jgi:hypothetical protein